MHPLLREAIKAAIQQGNVFLAFRRALYNEIQHGRIDIRLPAPPDPDYKGTPLEQQPEDNTLLFFENKHAESYWGKLTWNEWSATFLYDHQQVLEMETFDFVPTLAIGYDIILKRIRACLPEFPSISVEPATLAVQMATRVTVIPPEVAHLIGKSKKRQKKTIQEISVRVLIRLLDQPSQLADC